MRIVTTEQMIKLEKQAEILGVSHNQLMGRAGGKIAEHIRALCASKRYIAEKASIVFLAGSGNNGGDCFAAASLLAAEGYCCTVINLIREPSTELSREYFGKLPKNVKIIKGFRSENASDDTSFDFTSLREAVISADILIDGVFGTGFRNNLSNDIMEIFSIESNAYRLAVDIPSGGNASTGTVSPCTFMADETICLGCLKFGMTQYPLRKHCGKITVADIGIPPQAFDCLNGERRYCRLDRDELAGFPKKRDEASHKGSFGTVLIICGSSSMRGAAAFAALGALRSGVGLVKIASVGKCIDTVSILAPEATYIEIDSDNDGFMVFNSATSEKLLKAMEKSTAVVIGSGMGVTENTLEILRFVLTNTNCPVIIDADGINCIACDIEILMNRKSEVILTPHAGEMARLMNVTASTVNENRADIAEAFAEKYGVTVVLKGAGTVISDNSRTAANHTGNSGMSRGGSGDILAGITAAISAQGFSPYEAACAGAYLHGLAGDAAALRYGQEAMLPRDIIDCLSDAFGSLKTGTRAEFRI